MKDIQNITILIILEVIDNNLRAKYSDIVIEPINAEGNAMHVYNYAEAFLGIEENASKYLHYEKHLVFDCDAPEKIWVRTLHR